MESALAEGNKALSTTLAVRNGLTALYEYAYGVAFLLHRHLPSVLF